MPRKVTLSVDFTVMLDDEVKTSDVTFNINVSQITPQDIATNKPCGRVLEYCTQENPE